MLLDKLLKSSDQVFKSTVSIDLPKALDSFSKFPAVDTEYENIIKIGGIHVFYRALRIFGFTSDQKAKNIFWWNKTSTWKRKYKKLLANTWAFAEDVFGNQFLFDSTGIVWLNSESGELKCMCKTFTEWIEIILDDIDFYTGRSIARSWEKKHPDQELTGQYLLCPVVPFICGGEYIISNLFRCDAQKCMLLKAEISRQIRGLPDGTKISINFK